MGKGSDHLQLIKFWPSRAPGKGVFGGRIFFGSALLQPARSVCVSLGAFFVNIAVIAIAYCYIAIIILAFTGARSRDRERRGGREVEAHYVYYTAR